MPPTSTLTLSLPSTPSTWTCSTCTCTNTVPPDEAHYGKQWTQHAVTDEGYHTEIFKPAFDEAWVIRGLIDAYKDAELRVGKEWDVYVDSRFVERDMFVVHVEDQDRRAVEPDQEPEGSGGDIRSGWT
ncbi:hypothetical protein PSPO01_05585 [Paraphaeosphaeria sporulosa]